MTYPQQPAPLGDDKFFSALFDTSFTKYLALNWIKIVYIVGLIVFSLVLLARLFGMYTVTSAFEALAEEQDVFSARDLEGAFGDTQFIGIIFALIDFFLSVITLRVVLEVINAWVRAARSWHNIQQRQEQGIAFL